MTTYNDTSVKTMVHNVCTKTQLDNADTISDEELYYVDMELDSNKVVGTDDDGNLKSLDVTSTEMSYLEGVTSNVQTQLDAKQDIIYGGTGIKVEDDIVTVVQEDDGNCTFVKGTLKGSIYTNVSGGYADLDDTFNLADYDTWSFKTKVVLGSSVGNGCILGYCGSSSNDKKFPVLQFASTGTLVFYASSNGTTWDIFSNQTLKTFTLNATYWIELGYTGSQYYFKTSTDGVTYTTDWTSNTTTKTYSSVKAELMSAAGGGYSLVASMDLSQTGFYGNDTTLWEFNGNIVAKATDTEYGLVKPDTTTITVNDGVISAPLLSGRSGIDLNITFSDGTTGTLNVLGTLT